MVLGGDPVVARCPGLWIANEAESSTVPIVLRYWKKKAAGLEVLRFGDRFLVGRRSLGLVGGNDTGLQKVGGQNFNLPMR